VIPVLKLLFPVTIMKVEKKWQEILSRLEENTEKQLIYVIGGIDSGKTTLCRFLAERLSVKYKTAYINCDPGQSVIGPPASLGMAVCHGKWGIQALRFIGSTSFRGHMLQILCGSGRLRDKAVDWGARKIIVDSSGFVYSPPGMAFQFETIDLLQPDVILGIEESSDLNGLIRNFRTKGRAYYSLPIHPNVIKRSPAERRAYRESKFREYFRNSRLMAISFRELGLHRVIPEKNENYLQGQLIALSDHEHLVITLGILDRIDMDRTMVWFYAPPFEKKSAVTLHFGALRLDLSGRHSSL